MSEILASIEKMLGGLASVMEAKENAAKEAAWRSHVEKNLDMADVEGHRTNLNVMKALDSALNKVFGFMVDEDTTPLKPMVQVSNPVTTIGAVVRGDFIPRAQEMQAKRVEAAQAAMQARCARVEKLRGILPKVGDIESLEVLEAKTKPIVARAMQYGDKDIRRYGLRLQAELNKVSQAVHEALTEEETAFLQTTTKEERVSASKPATVNGEVTPNWGDMPLPSRYHREKKRAAQFASNGDAVMASKCEASAAAIAAKYEARYQA